MIKFVSTALFMLLSVMCSGQTGAIYTLTNNTGSSGGTFPITTIETFQALNLTETFSDLSVVTIPLYRGGVQVNTLSAFQVRASSRPVNLDGVINASISGTFSNTSVQIARTSGGSKSPATILSSFSSSFTPPTQNSFTYIFATDANTGELYRAGQFNTAPSAVTGTPEPNTAAMAVSMILCGLLLYRRRVNQMVKFS